jgi:hypothetical protein
MGRHGYPPESRRKVLELLAAKCRIGELETELRAMRRAMELVREVVPQKAVPAGWPNREHLHRGMRIQLHHSTKPGHSKASSEPGAVQAAWNVFACSPRSAIRT